jgi:hypothetical protein
VRLACPSGYDVRRSVRGKRAIPRSTCGANHRLRHVDTDVVVGDPERLDEGGQRISSRAPEIDDLRVRLDEMRAHVEDGPAHGVVLRNRTLQHVGEDVGH